MQKRVKSTSPKERLLDAALELFGERDPSSVSVREIAKKADVNIASINYHFQSKEGLYIAVVEQIANMLKEQIDIGREQFLQDREQFLQVEHTQEEQQEFYIQCYQKMIARVAQIVISKYIEDNRIHRIMVREQMNPTAAFEKLFKELSYLFEMMDMMMEGVTQKKESHENIIRVHMLFGQIIIFVVSNAVIRKRLGIKQMDSDTLEEIKSIAVEHTTALLHYLKEKGRK